MAVARQVELFENAFNKAKENGGIWLENDGRKAPRLYLKPCRFLPSMPSYWVCTVTRTVTRPTNIHFFSEAKNAVSPSRPKKREAFPLV